MKKFMAEMNRTSWFGLSYEEFLVRSVKFGILIGVVAGGNLISNNLVATFIGLFLFWKWFVKKAN